MRRADYLALLRTTYGNQNPSTEVATEFGRIVNEAYEETIRHAGVAFWSRRYHAFVTVAPIEQTGANGVASATGGSRLVTLATASRVDRRYIGAFCQIAGAQETYLITDVRSGTSIVIDPPFSGAAFGTAVTNQDFLAYQSNYRLPPNFVQIGSVKQSSRPLRLRAVSQLNLDSWVPDPVIMGDRGAPELYLPVGSGGLPAIWGSKVQRTITAGGTGGLVTSTLNDIRISDTATTADFFNDAILAVASGGAGASILRGFFVRLAGDAGARYYKIREVVDAATDALHIDEPWNSTSLTAAEFTIGPSDPGWLRLYPLPDATYHIDLEYFALPAPMQADDDEPVLPRQLHNVIADGALLGLSRYMREAAMADRFEAQFAVGLRRVMAATKGTGDAQFRLQARPRLDRWNSGLMRPTIPNIVEVS